MARSKPPPPPSKKVRTSLVDTGWDDDDPTEVLDTPIAVIPPRKQTERPPDLRPAPAPSVPRALPPPPPPPPSTTGGRPPPPPSNRPPAAVQPTAAAVGAPTSTVGAPASTWSPAAASASVAPISPASANPLPRSPRRTRKTTSWTRFWTARTPRPRTQPAQLPRTPRAQFAAAQQAAQEPVPAPLAPAEAVGFAKTEEIPQVSGDLRSEPSSPLPSGNAKPHRGVPRLFRARSAGRGSSRAGATSPCSRKPVLPPGSVRPIGQPGAVSPEVSDGAAADPVGWVGPSDRASRSVAPAFPGRDRRSVGAGHPRHRRRDHCSRGGFRRSSSCSSRGFGETCSHHVGATPFGRASPAQAPTTVPTAPPATERGEGAVGVQLQRGGGQRGRKAEGGLQRGDGLGLFAELGGQVFEPSAQRVGLGHHRLVLRGRDQSGFPLQGLDFGASGGDGVAVFCNRAFAAGFTGLQLVFAERVEFGEEGGQQCVAAAWASPAL